MPHPTIDELLGPFYKGSPIRLTTQALAVGIHTIEPISKVDAERKFFPGYVLIQMVLNDDTWHLVKETPRVMGFIGGTADKPAPITQREVNDILNRLEETVDKPAHKTVYEPGELVRVVDGPFNDFTGTVEEVNYEKNRVRVAVLIFGRSTPVELEFSQVEKG